MRVLITGAGGFVGARLVEALLAHPSFDKASFTLSDNRLSSADFDARVRLCPGDLSDEAVRDDLAADRPNLVFHLAGALGGIAESNYRLSRDINVDATLALFESFRDCRERARVIFASSIAVYGPMNPSGIVTDDTPAAPLMVYGAQKLMMETALTNFSVRGEIDGISLRLPGIVARPDADDRMKSSYLHRLFFAFKHGLNFTLPVRQDGTSWLISVAACVDALIHAALLPNKWDCRQRAFMLPAQRVSMQALLMGLSRAFPSSNTEVAFCPDEQLEAQFARQPQLITAVADRLGFKHDGSIDELIRRATQSE